MLSFKKPNSKVWFWSLALVGMLIYGWAFFPVKFSPDARGMYEKSIHFIFLDCYPIFHTGLWYLLDHIYPGGGPMLLVNFLCLWGACLVGASLFQKTSVERFLFLLVPFLPPIFKYADSILKDNFISYGYMLIVALLAKKHVRHQGISWGYALFLLTLVLFSTSAKAQAFFFFFLPVGWIVSLLPLQKRYIFWKRILLTGVLSCAVWSGMKGIEDLLIRKTDNLHFWQYVKIYDLSGISVMSGQMTVPKFLWKRPDVSVKDIENHYQYFWEPLIKKETSPLRATQSDAERKDLVAAWRHEIVKHPGAYLKHRVRNWLRILGGWSVKKWYVPYFEFSFHPLHLYTPLLPFIPLFMFFWGLSLARLHRRREAAPVFVLTSMGLILVFVLFIFSLAATPRYIYFSWCCFGFSVPFIWSLLRKNSALLRKEF